MRQNVSKADPVDVAVEDSELDPTELIERGIQLIDDCRDSTPSSMTTT